MRLSHFGRLCGLALAAAVSIGLTQPGNAATYGTYQLNLSDGHGTGPFGSITVVDLDPSDGTNSGTAKVTVSVAPNFNIDTGGHFILTFSLAGGSVASISNSHFSLVTSSPPFTNSPFGDFTSAIKSDCPQGSCTETNGQLFSFNILNFVGLLPATQQFLDLDVIFAADIATPTGQTFVTGATFSGPPPSGGDTVPLPAALPLFATGLGVLAWAARRRKRKAAAAGA